MCEGVWVCRVCDMCLCGVVSFSCLPTVRPLVPYKTRGERPGQLSQRKISISTLVDKEGKGLNTLEAMSVQVVDREGKDLNKGVITWKTYCSLLRISEMQMKSFLWSETPPILYLPWLFHTISIKNWTVGRPGV